MKSILHLTLKREFFAEIVAGTKRIEYRERKKYWKTRLEGRRYDVIQFRNGYGARVPEMTVEFAGLRRYRTYYAIRLGRILNLKRWKSSEATRVLEKPRGEGGK
jgi:ASC-1-like (ASCH) protein